MPADVRVDHERELAGLEQELAVEEAEIQKQEMTGKYHMVRFFGICRIAPPNSDAYHEQTARKQ